ncbi:ribosome 60S biogenesis N-terminal-domain-containing protein [Lenzites betulinus]|nr:ribosome 60S biogenesis N-terminal-domain-containing protein [Lenzites betulinus]
MPTREQQPSSKKRKVDVSSKQGYKYHAASDIQRALKAQSEAGLIESLTALRNQLTVKTSERSVAVNDERLVLAREWLEADPGAQELFQIWESANSRQTSLLAATIAVFAALLSLLSSHYTYHTYAQPIFRVLLSQQWTHQLNMYLAGQHTELILVTLKLYNSVTSFAGGRERKAVLDAFAWEMKSLPRLLQMRRKSKGGEDGDMLLRPDIRTLYMILVLSFLDTTTTPSVKTAFLEQHRDAFTIIFKGLWQDPYPVIRRVLEVSWAGLWSDAKLKRTLKIQVFNEATLTQLLRIYERGVPEGSDPESVPADVVHHFLLALCSHPGAGLCFHDRGWYPREIDLDQKASADMDGRGDSEKAQKGGRIYNKILANVVKTLKVNEDPRQQELALKILAACPELISGYWSAAGLALEPRLSSKWLANIAFFGSVVSLPVPTSSFFLPQSGSSSASLYQPNPPPLSTMVENILPTAQIKIHLSRGLQATSPLVQHASALALSKCLLKYQQVVQAFQEVERALEEDEEEGLWTRRRHELEREVRKRMPDFQVIVGFSQRLNDSIPPVDAQKQEGKEKQKERTPNPTRTALLTETAHRLLWLYHRLLPSVVAEARFDAGKLLQAIEDMLLQTSAVSPTAGLDTLRQLHVLRLLKETENFTWSGKSGSKHSNFHILLKAYAITPVPAVRTAIVALLRHILSAGVLFQHDADEIALWLDALPLTRRAAGAKAPDGGPLTDEGDGVITFLDDCVQRCVKTPYKYVEELQLMHSVARLARETEGNATTSSIGERPEAFPSPLLATVLEQLGAKLKGKLVSPSDALALFAFVRKLTLRIASKSVDLDLATAIMEKLTDYAEDEQLFSQHASIRNAIQREVSLFKNQMAQLQDCQEPMDQDSMPAVTQFLTQVESLDAPSSEAERQTSAYELVDWVRLIDPQLSSSDLARLVQVIGNIWAPALKELVQYLDPRKNTLWSGIAPIYDFSTQVIGFDALFSNCTHTLANDQTFRATLVEQLFITSPDVITVKRAIRLILHRLAYVSAAEMASGGYLHLLAEIVEKHASTQVGSIGSVVLPCFDTVALKTLCSHSLAEDAREGLDAFLTTCQTIGDGFKPVLSGYIAHWVLALHGSLDNDDEEQIHTALLWFKYAGASEALSLLDHLADRAEHSSAAGVLGIIDRVLSVTAHNLAHSQDAIAQALPLLSRLHAILPDSATLQALLASGTAGLLPLCNDGYLPGRSLPERSMASLVSLSTKRWSLRLESLPLLSAESFISAETWTDATVDVLITLLYRQQSTRSTAITWLESPASKQCVINHLVGVVFAVYDSAREGDAFPSPDCDAFASHFVRLCEVVKEANHPREICSKAGASITSIIITHAAGRPRLLKSLNKHFGSTTPDRLSHHSLDVAVGLAETIGAEAHPLGEQLIDLGLKWAVNYYSDNEADTEDDRAIIVALATLLRTTIPVKSHLAEPIIATVVQDRLKSIDGLHFAQLLVNSVNLKPVTVNKYLQTIVQHTRFYELCATSTSTGKASPRDSIVDLLHDLFHLHPTNTCQPSHIQPLRRVYGGTLGPADRKILAIFQLFEATRKTSVASLFAQWSGSGDDSSRSALEVLQSLDPSRVLKTCLEFPQWRTLEGHKPEHSLSGDSIYDPVFVLLLFAQMLGEGAPTSALEWVQLFRTNVVSLLLRALSARDIQVREIAWAQTAVLYRNLENADLQEQPHVMHILHLLKDLAASAPTDDTPRIPAYTTLLLAHAFRGIFYPSNFIYPLTARFLLQRPTLDASDVPMLYGMLYSSSDDWKKERAWILRFLSDGIVGSEEWRILKRRHTWDLLASLFQSEERDKTLRRGVLEVLANVTCNARATTSLVLRHALFSWIEMQLQTMRSEEAIAWARILENVLAVISSSKIELATDGEWREIAGRCAYMILRHSACTLGVFVTLVSVLLRLSLLPGKSLQHVPLLLRRSLYWLEQLEADVAIPPSGHLTTPLKADQDTIMAGLHRSQHLFDPAPTPTVELWGECTQSLWRVSISVPWKTAEWDMLASRLLIWRSIAGASKTKAGEWTRREVLQNIRADT